MSDNEQSSGSPSELELLKARARLLGVEFSNNIGLETLRERVAAKMAAMDGDDAPISQPTTQATEQSTSDQPNPLGQVEGENPLGDFDDDIEEEAADEITQPAVLSTSDQPNPLGQVEGENPLGDFDDDIEEEAADEITQPAVLSTSPIELKPIAPLAAPDLPDPTKSTSLGSPVAEATDKPLTFRQQLFNDNMKLIRVRIQNLDPKKKDLSGEIISVSNKVLGTVKRFVPYGESMDDNGWHIPYVIYKELSSRKFLQITTSKDRQTKQVKVVKRWAKEFAFEVLPPLSEKELKALAAAQAAAGSIENSADQIL
jgi:hypothetical protein